MAGRTVVVTGASSGIGKATATALARAGARTVLTGRDADRTRAAADDVKRASGSDDVHAAVFDLSDLSSVQDGATQLLAANPQIHVLVNNAGLVLSDRRTTVDGFEATFATNHLGPFLLTRLLTDRLVESAPARVVTVTSDAHKAAKHGLDFDDLQSSRDYRGMQTYGRSKLANILFTTELARRLTGTGVTANCCHPGVVATGFARDGDAKGVLAFGVKLIKPFVLTPEKGARTSVFLASSPEVAGVTGKYFVKCKEATPTAAARDAAAAERLWAASEELVTAAGAARS